jgi:hypothetical protein
MITTYCLDILYWLHSTVSSRQYRTDLITERTPRHGHAGIGDHYLRRQIGSTISWPLRCQLHANEPDGAESEATGEGTCVSRRLNRTAGTLRYGTRSCSDASNELGSNHVVLLPLAMTSAAVTIPTNGVTVAPRRPRRR